MNTSNFSFPTLLSFPNNLSEVTVNGIDVVASVVWSELPFTPPPKTTNSNGVGVLLGPDNIAALEKTTEPLPYTDRFALLNTPTVTVQIAPPASQEPLAVNLVLGANNLFSESVAVDARRSPLEPTTRLGARQQILVQWDKNLGSEHRENIRSLLGGRLVESIHTATMKRFNTGVLDVIEVPLGMEAEQLLRIYAQRSDVVFAELNYVVQADAVSNDPSYTNGSLWGMYSNDLPSAVGPNGTTNLYGSQAEKAWDRGLVGSNSVYVGIIDEGIQFDHPDLAANIWLNPFDPVDGIDNDGNGYIDDIRGWDFFYDDNSIYDGSVDNHGTHVAGTVGGVGGNGIGVAGVNWNVTMIATKFLGPDGGTIAGAIKAVDYLTDLKVRHGINIVASNNSWSGGGFSQGLLDAMVRSAQQDILFVGSAGNATRNNDTRVSYPSGYDTTAGAGYDAVVAVASIDKLGNISSFSNYGANSVDLGAPGSSVYSTLPNSTYGTLSGTSMAAPHVTGAIALYAAANPNASGAEIRQALLSSTAATPSLASKTVTGGRLDVNGMLLFDPAPPTLAIAALTADQSEGDLGTKAFTFTVTRSGNTSGPNSVNWSLSGTGDNPADAQDFGGSLPSGTLNFAAGETVQEIVVNVTGDLTPEADETFTITLSEPTQGATLTTATAEGIIGNDDIVVAPTLAIAALDSEQSEGDDGTKAFTFTVTRSGNLSEINSVAWSVSGTGENPADADDFGGSLPSGTLNFAAGETVQEIVVNVTGDLTPEADETFTVTLSEPTQGATLATATAEGIIGNDDQTATTQVIFAHSFENNQDSNLWTQDRQKDWFTSSQRAKSGSYSAEIDGKATNATLGLTSPLDLSAYEDLSLSFSWFIESNWDNGEYIALDLFNNGVWSEVQRLSGNQSPEGVWNDVTLALPSSANFNLRFRSTVSDSSEDGNVDDIVIMGTTTNAGTSELPGELATASAFTGTEAYGLTNP